MFSTMTESRPFQPFYSRKGCRDKNSQERFDGEVAEKISVPDKFKKFKKSKLHIDKEIYKIAPYEVQKLISYKKKQFFENRLNHSIGKPKELWKALNSLGLPSKTSVCGTTAD